jgi:hypothetical protein
MTNKMIGDFKSAAGSFRAYQTKNSLLEKKSFLQFEFPDETDVAAAPRIVRLPFFEDPDIRESKSARYASYKPLSRASELFAYLGSDARTFSLTFKMTLPHIVNLYNLNKALAVGGGGTSTPLEEKKKFFGENAGVEGAEIGPNAQAYTDAYFPKLGGTPIPPSIGGIADAGLLVAGENEEPTELGFPFTRVGYDEYRNSFSDEQLKKANDIKDILMYWIDIIRSSVYNNVLNPLFGPPIVKLTHGMMFRSIPCITTNYNISFDPNTGYDKDTMIPRVILVTMELKENRVGNYGEFDPGAINSVTSENLAGWEAVILRSDAAVGGTLDAIPSIQPVLS